MGRLDRLKVERCGSTRDEVGELRRTQRRLVGVRRGFQDDKVGSVSTRCLDRDGQPRCMAAHDLRDLRLPAISPACSRALRVKIDDRGGVAGESRSRRKFTEMLVIRRSLM
jgi:hypothetical protein